MPWCGYPRTNMAADASSSLTSSSKKRDARHTTINVQPPKRQSKMFACTTRHGRKYKVAL
eukprot:5234445-Amphidinium_carterae.1